MLLQGAGYEVISSLGLGMSLINCVRSDFDLFILGYSIPYSDKQLFWGGLDARPRHAPIISLRRNPGEQIVCGASYHIEADPEPL